MNIIHEWLPVGQLETNTGQIAALPANPRQWTRTEMENLVESIKETPELLAARGAIVYPHEGKYIILGGNMRSEAIKALKWPKMPCIILPEETPLEKLREIVIKDNGIFGAWDYDQLANEWSDLPLSDWGVPVWDMPTEQEHDESSTEAESIPNIIVAIPIDHAGKVEAIKAAIRMAVKQWDGCLVR